MIYVYVCVCVFFCYLFLFLFLLCYSSEKFQPSKDKSRDILTTNVSQQQHDAQDYGAKYLLSTIPPDVIRHSSILTENDKLPWPIPYENAERESKWKTIRPTPNVYYKRNYVSLNHTLDNSAKVEVTSSGSVASTNSYASLTTAIPSYHPYTFESNHFVPPTFYPSVHPVEFPTYQPDSDIYAQPIDSNNETKLEYINAKDSQIPVQRINKE